MKIEFVKAPPAPRIGKRRNGNSKYFQIAKQLKSRPGDWALVLKGARAVTPTLIKKGNLVAFKPAGSFEAVARSNGVKGKADIYARYIGSEEG